MAARKKSQATVKKTVAPKAASPKEALPKEASPKEVSLLGDVNELKNCIAQCEGQLTKAYDKAKKQNSKQLLQQQGKLTKVRAKLKVARERVKTLKADQKGKKGKALIARMEKAVAALTTVKEEFQLLQQAVQVLKLEKVTLKVEIQQQIAREKAMQQFNKAWAKAQKEKLNAKRSKRKQHAAAVSIVVSAEDAEEMDMLDVAEPVLAE